MTEHEMIALVEARALALGTRAHAEAAELDPHGTDTVDAIRALRQRVADVRQHLAGRTADAHDALAAAIPAIVAAGEDVSHAVHEVSSAMAGLQAELSAHDIPHAVAATEQVLADVPRAARLASDTVEHTVTEVERIVSGDATARIERDVEQLARHVEGLGQRLVRLGERTRDHGGRNLVDSVRKTVDHAERTVADAVSGAKDAVRVLEDVGRVADGGVDTLSTAQVAIADGARVVNAGLDAAIGTLAELIRLFEPHT